MFSGGAHLDAVEMVSTAGDVTAVLDGLVAKSLVEFEHGQHGCLARAEPRYLVLEPIRQYVAGWCALWLAQTADDDRRDHWIGEVLRVGRDPRGRPMLGAVLYHFAGPDALARGEHDLARLHFDEAVELCRASGDRSNELSTLLGASLAFLEHDDPHTALSFVGRASQTIALHGTTYQQRLTVLVVGELASRQGDRRLAARLRAAACEGTTAFTTPIVDHSTPHNRSVASLLSRLPADHVVAGLTVAEAFDEARRWIAAQAPEDATAAATSKGPGPRLDARS